MSQNRKQRKAIALPIKVGIALTFALLALISYLGSIYRCVLLESAALECRYNFSWMLDSPPNEIGDTIAGVFATLAFVWIVVTVFLQSAELSEQREELKLTREELRLSREAQEKLVETAQIQAEIFKDEKLARDQAKHFSEVEALAKEILRQAKSEHLSSASWRFEKPLSGNESAHKSHFLIVFRDYQKEDRIDLLADKLATCITEAHEAVNSNLEDGWRLAEVPVLSELLHDVRKMIERIEQLSFSLSDADKVRARSLGLEDLLSAIEDIEDHPEYWLIWGDGEQK